MDCDTANTNISSGVYKPRSADCSICKHICAREGYHQLRPIPYELVHIIYDDLIHDSKDQYFCITIDPGITIV